MARAPRTLLAPVALALLLVAGCGVSGSDDASPTTDGSATTEAQTPPTDDPGTTTEATDPEDPTTTEAEDPTTTIAGGGDEQAICDALQPISDYDQESSATINGGADWDEIKAFLLDNVDDVVAAYDDAIAVADGELAEQLTTLRDFTADFADTAAEASSLEELSTEITSQEGVLEAGEAGQALDTFAEANCGFSTGGT